MRHYLEFKNPQNGEIKKVKVGFAWTVLFFAGWFGLPFFLRQVYTWGSLFLVLSLLPMALAALDADDSLVYLPVALALVLSVVIAFKANEITAKNYMRLGWKPLEPKSPKADAALKDWTIPEQQRLYTRAQKIRGYAIIAIGVIAVIFLANLLSRGPRGLRVEADGPQLSVTNVGRSIVELRPVTVNDRADCQVRKWGTVQPFVSVNLNVGDVAMLFATCNIVRVTVETNEGRATFGFDR